MIIQPVLRSVLAGYVLPWDGVHGVPHWARVLENGLRLAEQTGAIVPIVTLFAVLHDSQRVHEGWDTEHGPRAAKFAATLRGDLFELPDDHFHILQQACAGHTVERTHPDITIQTCWDADRLDLGRAGITLDPAKLCTSAARDDEMIRWADNRARIDVVPALVLDEWGIEL